ncbi:MAG: hypothetical protein QXU99_04080 [Candidatus Bathyarchaeia archaeon]
MLVNTDKIAAEYRALQLRLRTVYKQNYVLSHKLKSDVAFL